MLETNLEQNKAPSYMEASEWRWGEGRGDQPLNSTKPVSRCQVGAKFWGLSAEVGVMGVLDGGERRVTIFTFDKQEAGTGRHLSRELKEDDLCRYVGEEHSEKSKQRVQRP